MQESEKAAAEPKTERDRSFGLVFEARIVEPKLREAVAQPLVIGRIGREQAAKDDRLHRLKAGQWRRSRPARLRDPCAAPAISAGLGAGAVRPVPPPPPPVRP